ncbi:MAG: hypothetical protein LYZ66_03990 [Nitrososphaerales archaeon]|nr:hypothetical protein [Nitrososphaerales archaeon]
MSAWTAYKLSPKMAHDTEEVLVTERNPTQPLGVISGTWSSPSPCSSRPEYLFPPLISDHLTLLEPGTDIMTEDILVVGMKGEIYTNEELRSKAGIRRGGRVKARVVEDKLVIEPILSIEEIIKKPVVRIGVREAEGISERAQKKAGAYG